MEVHCLVWPSTLVGHSYHSSHCHPRLKRRGIGSIEGFAGLSKQASPRYNGGGPTTRLDSGNSDGLCPNVPFECFLRMFPSNVPIECSRRMFPSNIPIECSAYRSVGTPNFTVACIECSHRMFHSSCMGPQNPRARVPAAAVGSRGLRRQTKRHAHTAEVPSPT